MIDAPCSVAVVSPGSRPRPSLSEAHPICCRRAPRVSPGSRPRPSLSDVRRLVFLGQRQRVAGVSAPAFVERRHRIARRVRSGCVAGVSAPAFVERVTRAQVRPHSPGVAGVSAPAFVERSCPASPVVFARRVAGVSAPAFVERTLESAFSPLPSRCRRGLGPGLR